MKLRTGIIMLMILALMAACMPASAETTSFPFLPGLSWESTLDDVKAQLGPTLGGNDESIGNSGRMIFFSPILPGQSPVRYEFGLSLTSDNSVSMVLILYDLSSAPDKDAVRTQIMDEMERLYGKQGQVLFDTPESMKSAFAGIADNSDVLISTALGGMNGGLNNIYSNPDDITLAKSWMVDRKYAAMVVSSSTGTLSDKVLFMAMDIEKTLFMMADANLPENRTGWLDLPAGINWTCSMATLKETLSSNGIIAMEQDGQILASTTGPDGSMIMILYLIENDQLIGSLHILSMDYDQIERLVMQEYGSHADVNEEEIKQMIQSTMGIPATRTTVWITQESMVYLFSSGGGNFVLQISTQMAMAQ